MGGSSGRRSCASSGSSGVRGRKKELCAIRGEVDMGASRGMMVLLVKQVHLQKEVGAAGEGHVSASLS